MADQLPTPATDRPHPLTRIEHIVQDGGSEGIEAVARQLNGTLIEGDSTIGTGDHPHTLTVYSEPDEGMYDAINKGLKKATGDICSYLNCDEQYLPGALQSVVRWFEAHPHKDVLFADAVLTDTTGKALSYRRTVLPDRWHTRLCHLNTLTCATFFRSSIIDRQFFFQPDKKIIGDGMWVDSMMAAGVKMGYLPEATSTFAFTGANLSELDRGPDSEQSRWLLEPDAPPRWLKRPVSTLHRIKKFGAGAYKRRSFQYSVFTNQSGAQRETMRAVKLSGGWPGQTS